MKCGNFSINDWPNDDQTIALLRHHSLGTITEFPSVKSTLSATDVSQAEDYIIRTHAGGVYLVGATDKGVANAAWDFLYRLGYRRFFPGKNWEVFPSQPNLSLTLDVNEHPDFLTRSVYSNYGMYGLNGAEWAEWNEANRIGGSVKIGQRFWDILVLGDTSE